MDFFGGLIPVEIFHNHLFIFLSITDLIRLDCALTSTKIRNNFLLTLKGFPYDSIISFMTNIHLKWFLRQAINPRRINVGPIVSCETILLLSNFPYLDEVHFSGIFNDIDDRKESMNHGSISMLPQLKVLNFMKCLRIRNDCIISLIPICEFLTTLCIKSGNLRNEAMCAFAMKAVHLQTLNLSECYAISDKAIIAVSEFCPCLENITLSRCTQITDRALNALAKGCVKLKYVEIRHCVNVTDSSVSQLVNVCTDLQHLDLHGCYLLTNLTIASLAQCSRVLSAFRIGGCIAIADDSIVSFVSRCTQLQTLGLRRCISISSAIADMLLADNVCVDLKELDVAHSVNLTDSFFFALSAKCFRLQVLDLAGLDQITDAAVISLSQHCPDLLSLVLDGCNRLTDSSISAIAQGFSRLQKLSLNPCHLVTERALMFLIIVATNLRHLNVSIACGGLTDSTIDCVSTACHRLQYLQIQRCNTLSENVINRFKKDRSLVMVSLPVCSQCSSN